MNDKWIDEWLHKLWTNRWMGGWLDEWIRQSKLIQDIYFKNMRSMVLSRLLESLGYIREIHSSGPRLCNLRVY
jgi:hypothetical protein